VLTGIAYFQQPLALDIWAKKELTELASPFLDHFFLAVTNLGSPAALVMFTVLVTICLIHAEKRREGGFLAATMLVGWGLMDEIKLLIDRPRPAGEHLTYASGFSFPSGHSMLSLVFYGFVVYLLLASGRVKSKTALVLIGTTLVFLIGTSRIYLNVHYASDVLGGFLIGGILLFVAIRLMDWSRGRWFKSWQ